MKVFEASEFEYEKISRFLIRKIRKKGIINRENCESLDIHTDLFRPFRYVIWKISGINKTDERSCVSLLDEDFAPIVTDLDTQLLLWRPLYSDLNTVESDSIQDFDVREKNDNFHLQSVIDNLVKRRAEALDILMAIDSDLHKMQRNSISASTLLLPRTPSYARKESQLVDEKKLYHSILIATSLVANCSITDYIELGTLGERVFVKTIIAEYIDNSTHASRWLFLETPGAKTINDTLKNGRALTRLVSLNEQCRRRIGL